MNENYVTRTNIFTNDDYVEREKTAGSNKDLAYLQGRYYDLDAVQFLLGKFMDNREVVVHSPRLNAPIRPFHVYPSKDAKAVKWFINRLDFSKTLYSVYATVFQIDWDAIGYPPTELEKLREYRDHFRTEFPNHRTAYDFVIDIDANKSALRDKITTPIEEFQRTKHWAELLHETLCFNEIPHYMNYSGGTGFQARIPSEFLPSWDKVYPYEAELAKELAKLAGIPAGETTGGVDLSVYGNVRRYFKVPYSVSSGTYAQGKIVLPVNTRELGIFTFDDYDLVNIIRGVNLYNHFWKHPKPEQDFLNSPGVIYDFNPENLHELIERVAK